MAWIKTPVRFTDRRAMLIVPYEVAAKLPGRLFTDLTEVATDQYVADNPEAIERVCHEMVTFFRPDLKGCVLGWFENHWPSGSYRIGITHRDLPQCPHGAPPEQILVEKC